MLLKRECIVLDNSRFRLITEADIPKIAGFYLMGQGFGDMICMLPLLKKTAQVLGRQLTVWTFRPEVLRGLSFVVPRPMDLDAVKGFCRQGNLLIVAPVEGNGIPSRFSMHLIDQSAYNIVALEDVDKEIILPAFGVDRGKIAHLIERFSDRKKIVLHPTSAAEIRSWPIAYWRNLAERLLDVGAAVLSVGKTVDYVGEKADLVGKQSNRLMIEHDNFIDLTDQLSFHETYALLKECDAVVTMDSGLLHIANATDIFVIALFTDVDPRHRMRYKNGRVGYRTVALSSPCPMQYCASQFGYNENKCRFSSVGKMCCLPSVEDVYAALRETILKDDRS